MPEADNSMPEQYDEYLNAEFLHPQKGDVTKALVVARKCDVDGHLIGKWNTNQILDTREYEVEFPDGATDTFTANVIAENLYSQIDEEGNSYSIFQEIVDHQSNASAVKADDGMEIDQDGQSQPWHTMKG